MTGILQSYSNEKEYGFIKGADNNDYFFHFSSLKFKQDGYKLCKGVHLSFDQKVTPKGYKAINILIDNNISMGYIQPDTVYTSRNGDINGWEIVENSKWLIHGSSRHSPDDAKNLMLRRAQKLGGNCLIHMEYYKTTGSEPGTGKGTYYYTIHNFCGKVVNIAKKSPNGKYKLTDFQGLNDRTRLLKSELIMKTSSSSNTKMVIWAVVILIGLSGWLKNNETGIAIFIITLLLGWRFIYSTDYDSWLQEL